MISLRRFALVFVILFSFVASAQAQLKIAVVDVQKALGSSESGKKAQEAYKAEVQKAQADIDKQKAEFEKKQEAYQKQKATLSEAAKQTKQDELAAMRRDLERKFQDSQEALQKKNVQLVGDISKVLREVIRDLGKEKGYSLVVDRSAPGFLFVDEAADITDQVVELLNERKK